MEYSLFAGSRPPTFLTPWALLVLDWPVQKPILEVLHMQGTDEQYRQRMLVLVDGKDPVKLQAAAPDRLAKLLNGVSPARARECPAPDKWSIAEIVVHMADTEVVFGYILRIRSRGSQAIAGRPGCPRRTFQVQNKRKPVRLT